MANDQPRVFAVFRQGVYRHECGGIFLDEVEAVRAAQDLVDADGDDYHEYHVTPFVLGQATKFDPETGPHTAGSVDLEEAQPLHIIKKVM